MKRFLRPQIIVVGTTIVALVALSGVVSAAGAGNRSHVAVPSSESLRAERAHEQNDQIQPTSAATTSSKTFTLVGGTVTFSCTGDVISLVSATPSSGFKVETKAEVEHGGQQIKVEFESATHESEIKAACVGGQVQAIEIQEESRMQPAPAATTSSRTFTLVGGTVTFSCAGNVISLVSAVPNTGFTVKAETEHGGQQSKAEFESSAHESKIEASCVGGQVQANEIQEKSESH